MENKTHSENTIERPPIIAVMGHIDHGKSALLDYIRKSNITDREYGGITQKIGAYEIATEFKEYKTNKITFIDTPGHAAFANMRSRGANVADIAVLVVAFFFYFGLLGALVLTPVYMTYRFVEYLIFRISR